MEITAAQVKALRDATGAGMMDCKRALEETAGDAARARDLLREKGLADAKKRSGRTAGEGRIHSYLHRPTPDSPPKIGVLLDLRCETDFVARGEDFTALAQNLALHIASMRPDWVRVEDAPPDVVEAERSLQERKTRAEGKPDAAIAKIVEGRMGAFFKDRVLYEQEFVRQEVAKGTVAEVIDAASGKLGEKIELARFVRWQVGEDLSSE